MRDYEDGDGLTVADIGDLCGRSMQRSVRRRNQELLRQVHRSEVRGYVLTTVLIIVIVVVFLMSLGFLVLAFRIISGA